MLLDVFMKSPEQKILSLFAMNPDRLFYGREISKNLGISLGAVHAALLSLEKRGLLASQHIGKTKLYRSRSSDPIIRSFAILNTLLVLEPLVEAIRTFSRRIILFGSYVTGSFTSSSDIDLFIVSGERKKIARTIDSFKRKSGRGIRPIIKDQVEWMELGKENPEFADELSRGITLWENRSVNPAPEKCLKDRTIIPFPRANAKNRRPTRCGANRTDWPAPWRSSDSRE